MSIWISTVCEISKSTMYPSRVQSELWTNVGPKQMLSNLAKSWFKYSYFDLSKIKLTSIQKSFRVKFFGVLEKSWISHGMIETAWNCRSFGYDEISNFKIFQGMVRNSQVQLRINNHIFIVWPKVNTIILIIGLFTYNLHPILYL